MGMTMTQKILAAHAGLASVTAGQLIEAKLDLVLGNDITAPVAIKEFAKIGAAEVFDKSKIALVPDHFAPNKDILSVEHCKQIREFAHKFEIENYFEIGEMGIEHCLIPEKGLAKPGDAIIGADGTMELLTKYSTSLQKEHIGVLDGTTYYEKDKSWLYYVATPYNGEEVPEGFIVTEIPAR
ncbi:MAG: 3-isopropylmalate dehydratase large subunit, partial [Clostridiales bacterium]|nr:3-isopropylmalate dehydratase large subunit [Clostridiales bacterium]